MFDHEKENLWIPGEIADTTRVQHGLKKTYMELTKVKKNIRNEIRNKILKGEGDVDEEEDWAKPVIGNQPQQKFQTQLEYN